MEKRHAIVDQWRAMGMSPGHASGSISLLRWLTAFLFCSFRTWEPPICINLSVPDSYARPLVQPLNEGPGASVEQSGIGDPPRGHHVTVHSLHWVYSGRPSIVKFWARKPRRIIIDTLNHCSDCQSGVHEPASFKLAWPNEKPLSRRVGM